MIINHKRKFVFICVPKTGSTTLSKHFIKTDNLNIERSWMKEMYHWPMAKLDKKYAHKGTPLHEYFRFAYHRNPWDRMVSSWIDFTSDRGHLTDWAGELQDTFKTFENFVLNFRHTRWRHDKHFQPTTYYTHHFGDQQIVSYVAMYHNWHADTTHIFQKLNMKIEELPGKKWRQTERDPDYRKYYTNDKMIEEVHRWFHRDITQFGDKF